jgi:hypothetical protein
MTPFITHLLPAVALGLCVAIPFGPIGLMWLGGVLLIILGAALCARMV